MPYFSSQSPTPLPLPASRHVYISVVFDNSIFSTDILAQAGLKTLLSIFALPS